MPIDRFGWNKKSAIGFAWYQGIGAVCFLFDIGVIYLLIRIFHLPYPAAVTLGFMAATLLNYVLARSTIYANTSRSHKKALIYFFSVATALLAFTVGGTVFLREVIGLKLYVARTLVGVMVGVAGYIIDCLVTFKLR
jgi:putative flippase GtrA